MEKEAKHYIRVVAGILVSFLVVFGVLNIAIDPFYAFGVGWDGPLARYKDGLKKPFARAELLRHHNCPTLLLGTSRVVFGLDPLSSQFDGEPVFNGGSEGAGMEETWHIFRYALENTDLRRVFLFVDFSQFSGDLPLREGYLNSRYNPDLEGVEYLFRNLFGYQTVEASVDTLGDYFGDDPSLNSPFGHRMGLKRRHAELTPRELFRRTLSGASDPTERKTGSDQEQVDYFRAILRRCAEEHIELVVAIPPTHVTYAERMHLNGDWPAFEAWKREIVALVDASPTPMPVWDFSSYSRWSTEEIPPEGDTRAMECFYEAAHFRPVLGDQIIARLLGRDSALEGFGQVIDARNIEAHLEYERTQRERWVSSHAQELIWLRSLSAH